MENLTIWNYNNSAEVRTVTINNEPWFVLVDVCKVLEIARGSKVAERLEEDEVRQTSLIDSLGRQQNTTIINESGLYSVILRSDKPQAKPFRKWVTSEVLPAIRKTGTYTTPKTQGNPELAKLRANAMMLNAKSRIANQMMKIWSAAGVEPQYQALAMNNYYDGLSVPRIALKCECTAMFDLTTIAKHLGVMSKSGKPHAQAVGAIVEKLKPLDEGECQLTPYSKNGHDDVSMQYTLSVEHKIKTWLEDNLYPNPIAGNGKNFTVTYKN